MWQLLTSKIASMVATSSTKRLLVLANLATPVDQSDTAEVRLIDDFSASGVSTVQVNSCTKLHTLDVAAALILKLLRESGTSGWVGKTIDLSAAYQQLSPESRWSSL